LVAADIQKRAKEFFPNLPDEILKRKAQAIAQNLTYTTYCVWNVGILSSFSRHQFLASYDIVEVDKEAINSALEILPEPMAPCFIEQALLSVNILSFGQHRSTVVKALIKEAPLEKREGISVPSLEKIIVDLFCNGPALSFLGESEASIIIENLVSQYSFNIDALLRYAGRRGKKKEIEELLSQINGNLKHILPII